MGQVNRLTRSKPCLKDKLNTGRAASSGFGWTSSNWSGYAISGKKAATGRYPPTGSSLM
ncbi:hypothetical protein ACFSQ7_36310 [Paenibacillus rhizoplanae]